MAKKTIIRKIEPELKEVEEKTEEEETLEEEIEQEEETFSEFMEGERTAPVLEAMPIPDTETEPLEQELEGVPTATTEDEEQNIYNMPDYGQVNYEVLDRERKRLERDRETNITLMEPRQTAKDDMRKIDVGGWSERMTDSSTRERRTNEDYLLRLKKSKQKDGLPFEG